MGKQDFIKQVLAQVRFRWDHGEIREELDAHLAERMEEYAAEGMAPEEAEARAVAAMGDAEEIGRALDREHKPWLGRLWIATNLLAVLFCVVFLLFGGPGEICRSLTLFLAPDRIVEQQVERITAEAEPLWAAHPNHSITLDNETFTFTDLLYFAPYKTYGNKLYIFIKAENKELMRGENIFWGEAIQNLVTDDTGTFECHGAGMGGDTGRGKSVYVVSIDDFPADTEYVDFHYDLYGRQMDFRVDLKEGVVIE